MLLFEAMEKEQTLYGKQCRIKYVLKYDFIYTVNIIFSLHSYGKKTIKNRNNKTHSIVIYSRGCVMGILK